jgi:hypothetical protein
MVTTTAKMSFVAVMIADSESPYLEVIIEIMGKVNELINYTKKLDTTDACEEFIRSVRYEHIVLIVTPDIIDQIFAKNIHEIRHIQSIFLFDPNKTLDLNRVYELRRLSYKVRILNLFLFSSY